MEVDKSNLLVKVGVAFTTGLSVLFAGYLYTEHLRKQAKKEDKAQMKKLKKAIEAKVIEIKRETAMNRHTQAISQSQLVSLVMHNYF